MTNKDFAGEAPYLTNPFVVEVRDQADDTFVRCRSQPSRLPAESGMLSATSVTTNSKGQAESTLTLGPNPGTNTVTVSVTENSGAADVQH